MPREFYFMPTRDIDVWMPASFSAAMLRNWGWHDVHCIARLKPGVTLDAGQEAMAALSRRITEQQLKRPRSATVTPLREEVAGKTYTSLLMLLGASAAILLIACVNLANLLMARGAARRREVAVRAALGAGRGRLLAQFLVESLVLAGLGAIAGLALAVPFMRFLETLVPETMAAVRLSLDWRVLAFSTAITVAAGLTFGLVPAFAGSRLALQAGLRDRGRGTAGGRSYRLQHSLIVVETALAVVLLTTGGLLLQTFQHLRELNLGIRSEQLLTLVTPLFRYRDFDRRVAFVDAQLEAIRADSRRRRRGRDLAHSPDGQRPGDVLPSRRTIEQRFPGPGRALARRHPRLLPDGRRAAARGTILRGQRSALGIAGGDRQRLVRRSQFPRPLAARRPVQVRPPGRAGLLVHRRRRRAGDSGSWRRGRPKADGLPRARTGRPDRRPAERHRGAHGGRTGVDCSRPSGRRSGPSTPTSR